MVPRGHPGPWPRVPTGARPPRHQKITRNWAPSLLSGMRGLGTDLWPIFASQALGCGEPGLDQGLARLYKKPEEKKTVGPPRPCQLPSGVSGHHANHSPGTQGRCPSSTARVQSFGITLACCTRRCARRIADPIPQTAPGSWSGET